MHRCAVHCKNLETHSGLLIRFNTCAHSMSTHTRGYASSNTHGVSTTFHGPLQSIILTLSSERRTMNNSFEVLLYTMKHDIRAYIGEESSRTINIWGVQGPCSVCFHCLQQLWNRLFPTMMTTPIRLGSRKVSMFEHSLTYLIVWVVALCLLGGLAVACKYERQDPHVNYRCFSTVLLNTQHACISESI